jgi:predicted MFS family arabinose efflux permease
MKLHYAFVVAAAVFVVLLVAAGVRATPSVLIVPLEHQFGWSRALLSSAVSVNLVLYGLIGPFAAALMERFGLRRTIVASLVLIATGVALTTVMTTSWQLILFWGVLVGAGTGTTAMVLGATVVQRWFHARRGTVMGILTASTATGQMIFLPMLAALVERSGWRAVSFRVALVAALLIPLVLILVRDRPADVGLKPYGAPDDHASALRLRPVAGKAGSSDLPPIEPPRISPVANALAVLKRGSRQRDFWLLAGSFFVCGATTNGLVGTHLVPACMDHGIPEVRAAGLLALMGIFDLFGTTASGWLTDRYDPRKLLAWYYGLRGLALLFLPSAFDWSFYGLPLFAMFYGLDWIATVPPTVRLTADAMGSRDAPIAFGWIVAAHQLGAGAGALGAGLIRTSSASYTAAWLTAGAICILAALIVVRIGRRQDVSLRPTT